MNTDKTPLEAIFEEWWKGLASDRGGRADLRRSATVLEIQLLPAFYGLARRLPHSAEGSRLDWLAAAAGVLAHVKEDAGEQAFAELLAAGGEGHPAFSDLRFRRLLAADRPDELLSSVRRAVQLARGRAPVGQLGGDLLYWGDNARKRWARGYYASSED